MRVVLVGPAAGQHEGADKTDHVQDAPGIEPGDQDNTQIENAQVGEQAHHVVAAGRGQDRRGKTFQRRNDGQRRSVLQNGQSSAKQRDDEHEAETHFAGDQSVKFHRGQSRQVKHPDAHALHDQRVVGLAPTQEPAQTQQASPDQGHAGVTQLNRHRDAFGRIAQQEGQPQEENQHPHLDQRVAAINQLADWLGQAIPEWNCRGQRFQWFRCRAGRRFGRGIQRGAGSAFGGGFLGWGRARCLR